MKESTKTALIIVGTLGVISAMSMVFMVAIAMKKTEGADSPGLKVAAEAFGRQTTEYGCEKEGLKRMRTCGRVDFRCFAESEAFAKHCLGTALPSAGFCERMGLEPGASAGAGVIEAVAWSQMECKKNHRGYESCPQQLGKSSSHCAKNVE